MNKLFYVYIMTNPGKTVLYTGVTSDLPQIVYQHQAKLIQGFTARYNVTRLVYYEVVESAESAISGEKQIKAGSRQKKIELISRMNPTRRDLSMKL